MNTTEMLAIKAEIEANAHLFSARRNRDYITMASVLNESRADGEKLTPLQVHECMLAEAPAAEPPA